MLVVEGVGAGRREVAHLLDGVLWVQPTSARRSAVTGPGSGSKQARLPRRT